MCCSKTQTLVFTPTDSGHFLYLPIYQLSTKKNPSKNVDITRRTHEKSYFKPK